MKLIKESEKVGKYFFKDLGRFPIEIGHSRLNQISNNFYFKWYKWYHWKMSFFIVFTLFFYDF